MDQQEKILKSLNWRYATKKFDPAKKIPEADWNVLAESLRLSPSSYGIQPWKFLVVRNRELLKKLRAATWNQSQVEDSSHYVVFITPTKMNVEHVKKYVDKTAEVRNVDPSSLHKFFDMMNNNLVKDTLPAVSLSWMQRQAYIAMGFLMEAAALLKIDTCAIEGLTPSAYDDLLGLKEKGWTTVACVALGYRSPEDQYQHAKKVRFDLDDVIEYVD